MFSQNLSRLVHSGLISLPGLQKRSAGRHASAEESFSVKWNLSKSNEKLSRENFSCQEKVGSAKDVRGKSLTRKCGVAEKKAKEKVVERQKDCLARRAHHFNSGRSVLYEQSDGADNVVHDELFENRSITLKRPKKLLGNSPKLRRCGELESYKSVRDGLGNEANPHETWDDFNGETHGLIRETAVAQKVIADELLENKSMRKRRLNEILEHRKESKSLDELKSANFVRGELVNGDNGESIVSKIYRYECSNKDKVLSEGERFSFYRCTAKNDSSLRFNSMDTNNKSRRCKMETLGKEGNLHNQANNAKVHDLYAPEKEIYYKGSNWSNSMFCRGTVDDRKLKSKELITSGRSGRIDAPDPSVYEGEVDGVSLENKVTSRTSETFTNVRSRAQVLNLGMEERIRNLAKQLNASEVNIPEWRFLKMINNSKVVLSEHTIVQVVQILGSFRNWKWVLQVIKWFHSHKCSKYQKSRYLYTTAIDVLGKTRRPLEALNIFNVMRKELYSYPDLAAYHCIAVTLGQAGLLKELYNVIDCMRSAPAKKFHLRTQQKWDPCLEPDLIVYNAVLNACAHQNQWEGAFWVLQELKERGISPSSTTYGLIMEIMLACGKYNLVHQFFKKSQGNFFPGALNYKVLVNTLWREGKVEEAVLAVKDMEMRGIDGSDRLYYDFARCLCSAGRCDEALHQINKICMVAKKPLVVIYTGLIQACLDSGNIENASFLFSHMKSFCSPNAITCNIMLKSYVEHGMFEEAKGLFQKMLSGSSDINRTDEFSRRVLPDNFTFNTMIEACIAASKWNDFENFYRTMLRHGHHFNERRHMRLIFDAWRAGKKNILKITWDHLTDNGRSPPPSIIKELFSMKMKEGKPAAALFLVFIHHDMKIKAFSERSWLNLLKNKVNNISLKTVIELLHELKRIISESAEPHPVHLNLLNACKEIAGAS